MMSMREPLPFYNEIEKNGALDFPVSTTSAEIEMAFECDETFNENSFVNELSITEETNENNTTSAAALDALVFTDASSETSSEASSENDQDLSNEESESETDEVEIAFESSNNLPTSPITVETIVL